ncbi:MAG: lactonase family protein [Firmicutes bacterium]|nr:lactonase family protein [Bacillota bacterium]
MKLLVSGYGKNDKSVQLVEIDHQMKYQVLSKLGLSSPSFFVEGDDYFYTFEQKSSVLLHIFQVKENKLFVVDSLALDGDDLTHLAYSKKHKMLIGCSYKNGSFFSVKILDGLFSRQIQYGTQVEEQKLSRAHCVTINLSETEVAIVNISLDEIFFFSFVEDKLLFTKQISVPIGSGPRHGVYLNNQVFYIITEYSNEIIVVDLIKNIVIQTISTLPHFEDKSFGATLMISNDKKHLYASNRGEDSIAIFEIQDNNHLSYIKTIGCGGLHPRHMTLSKDNKLIFSCNLHSNQVSVIDIKEEKVILEIPFEVPSCVFEI